MADDQRPPPPYAPTRDIRFDWDVGTRTYGLTFDDLSELEEDPMPSNSSPPDQAVYSPDLEDIAHDTNEISDADQGPSQRAAAPPSAFWSQLYRQRTITEAPDDPDDTCSTQTISFLELPAEIRIAIYEYVCPLRGFATTFMARGSCLIPPPLAKTNRKVRSEVLPIFYGSNVFQIPMSAAHRQLSFQCLDLVAPHVHLLREIRSVAPERRTASWNVRFGMAIEDRGRQVTFTSQEPLTLASQQSILRVLLTSKAVRFARTFNGRDFWMFFTMLQTGTVYFEIDRRRAGSRNAEHKFTVRPTELRDVVLIDRNIIGDIP